MKQLLIISICLLSFGALSQLDRSIRPEAAPAPGINIKDSEVFTTENGITVILSENHKLPRVSFDLVMGSDPQAEVEMSGLADIAGSLIMSGTKNRSKDQIDNEIDYIGASLYADRNSITLSCLTKHMPKGLDVMSDILLNANFPQDEVDRIVKQNESNLLSTKSSPGAMANNAEAVAIFPKGHPYGEVMTDATLANINRDAILDYYKRNFTPTGSYLVVIGDINRAGVEKVIADYFASWTGGKSYSNEWGTGQFNDGNRVIFVKKTGAVQSVIRVSFAMNLKPSDDDYLKVQLLNSILGGSGFGARLMQNLREDKAFTYGCRSSLRINNDGSWFSAGGDFRNEVTDSAITEILYEIERITNEYVSDEELSLSKMSMSGRFSRSLERPSTVARFALSIIRNELESDYYQTYLKRLEAISKEDILEVAQKYLRPGKCNIIVVGNEEVLEKISVFDQDGEIEKLDAFGQEVVELIPSDLTADEVLENYVAAVTQMPPGKKRDKKIGKIKSMVVKTEMTMDKMPFPLKAVEAWVSPNTRCSKSEGNGMVFQREYSSETGGSSFSMQAGKESMTEDQVAARKKTYGLIPEMNYSTSGMSYEVTGIEMIDGAECYVIKLNDGQSEQYDYYAKDGFLKVASKIIETIQGTTIERNLTFGNYEETDGILFPTTVTMSIGEAFFDGKITSRELNEDFDVEPYK